MKGEKKTDVPCIYDNIPGLILFLTDKNAFHKTLSSFVSKADSST
jgi:hypothetical protein